MKISLIDIGSNLTHASFDGDRDAVLARALEAGVDRQVVTGADLPSSRQAAALALASPAVLRSTAGVHPHHAQSFDSSLRDELTDLARGAPVVAVGECGLDYFRDFSPRDVQRSTFIAQLEIAAAVQKPVFLHQRDAHEDFTAILREFRGRLTGGVAHCFTGGRSELEDYLALDLSIGVTGWSATSAAASGCAKPSLTFHPIACWWKPTRPIFCPAISSRGPGRGAMNPVICRTLRAPSRICAARACKSWRPPPRAMRCVSSDSDDV